MTASPVVGLVLLADSSALPDGGHRSLIDVVGDAIDGGARTVIVRDKDRPEGARRDLVAAVRQLLAPFEGTVLVARDEPGDALGAHGVHLRARDEWCQTPFVTRDGLLGVSAHDADEIDRAVAAGADYVTVSPVYPTASKPGYGPALEPTGLASLIAASPVPVVALGGITTSDRVAECLAAGAVGVAVMGAVLGAKDPAAAANDLLISPPDLQNSAWNRSETDLYPPEFPGGTR